MDGVLVVGRKWRTRALLDVKVYYTPVIEIPPGGTFLISVITKKYDEF